MCLLHFIIWSAQKMGVFHLFGASKNVYTYKILGLKCSNTKIQPNWKAIIGNEKAIYHTAHF
jgi:hypothetical protein